MNSLYLPSLISNVTFILNEGTGPFSFTTERAEAVFFSSISKFVSYGLFIKNPEHVYNYAVYFEPLAYLSWMAIMLFLFLFPIVLFILARLVKEPVTTSIFEAFETVSLAIFVMDSPFKPSCFTTRIVFLRYVTNYNIITGLIIERVKNENPILTK